MRFIPSRSIVLAMAIIGAWSTGCSKGSSGGAASTAAVGVSGSLSISNTSQSVVRRVGPVIRNGDSAVGKLALSDYTVVCATNTAPPLTGTSAVSSDGSFSMNIAGASGQPLSCYLVDANGDKVADFLIENTASKDMNGNAERLSTVTPTGNLSMGAIDFDPDSGEVTVPGTAVASSIASAAVSSVYDPTGAWTISAVDYTLPNGVRSTCTSTESMNGTCNGPPDGQQIYLKLWSGTKVADSSPMYGLQVWDSESGFNACGGKIGLPSSVKTDIGVDFSSNGAADDVFSFATAVSGFADQVTSTTGTVNLTDYWKMDTATLLHDIDPGCGPVDITLGSVSYSNAWKCGPDNSSLYQISLSGGCTVDSTGRPVELQTWTGLVCGSMSIDSNGIRTTSCSGNATVNSVSTAVTCTNKWAVVNASNAVQSSSGVNFNWSDLTGSRIVSGTSCSTIANSGSANSAKLAQLQCYQDYYWRSGMAQNTSSCMPRINADWSSTDPDDFIHVDFRPSQMVFFDQYKPFPDGNGGTILTRQENYNGVQVNGNNWVNCRVISTGGLSVKKISSTKLLATYQSSEITTSTSKPACLAAYTGTKTTFVFYLSK